MNNKKISYSQSGEDLIIDFALNTINVKTRFYIDIGTNDPVYLNNTFLFYEKGHDGVCVEPDPMIYNSIIETRPRDISLNIGIGDSDETMTLFLMEPNTLNSFSEEEITQCMQHYPWVKKIGEKKLQVKNINRVLTELNCALNTIDIMSIDTEGLDWEIVKSLNIKKFRPKLFCIETAEYCDDRTLLKNNKIIEYLEKFDYFKYADTFVNTIFVDKKLWIKNNGPKLEGF